MPAPGQGALAVQCRAEDPVETAVRAIDVADLRAAVTAERHVLARLEGGCQAPIGALCATRGGALALQVRVYAPDGSRVLAADVPVHPATPADAADTAAEALLAQGAGELIAAARAAEEPS